VLLVNRPTVRAGSKPNKKADRQNDENKKCSSTGDSESAHSSKYINQFLETFHDLLQLLHFIGSRKH